MFSIKRVHSLFVLIFGVVLSACAPAAPVATEAPVSVAQTEAPAVVQTEAPVPPTEAPAWLKPKLPVVAEPTDHHCSVFKRPHYHGSRRSPRAQF